MHFQPALFWVADGTTGASLSTGSTFVYHSGNLSFLLESLLLVLILAIASSDSLKLNTEITVPLKLALPDAALNDEILFSKPYTFGVFFGNEYPHTAPLFRISSQI